MLISIGGQVPENRCEIGWRKINMPTLSERIQEAINTAQEYNDLPLSERIQLQIDMANRERNRKEMGITERSLKRGIYQMGSMGGGMVGIAGSLAGKIGVPEHIAGPIRDWGVETYGSLGRKASLYPADTETSFDLLTSPSQAAKWTWESIVENLPYMAVTFGSSAAWKVVGSKVASGVLGGALERLTGKKLALDAMERFGSRFGLVSTTAALEGGGMWGETLERSGVDNPISAIAGGTVNGFIELAGGMSSVFDRVLGVTRGNLYRQAVGNMRKAVSTGQTISPKDASIVNRLLHELRTTAPQEFQQEWFQELVTLSNIAINDPTFEVFTQENVERLVDAGARGGAAGLGTGVMSLPLQDRYSLVREKVESLDPAELRQAIQSQSKLLAEQPENEDLRQVINILLQRQLRDTHAGYRELLDAYNRTKDPAVKKQLGAAIIAAQEDELRRLKEEGAEKKYTILRDTGEPGEKTKPGESEKKYTILKDTGEPDEKYTNLRVLTENPTEVVLVPEGEGAARVSRAPEGEGAARVSRAPEGEGASRVSRVPEGEGESRVSRVPEGELATSISEGKEAAGAVSIPEKELRTRYKAPEGEEGGLVMRVPEGEGAASVVNIPEEESATRISRVRRETPKGEGAARWGENTEDLINAWTHGKQVPPHVFRGATPEEEERVREQRHREWEERVRETNLDRFIDQSLRSRLGELLDKRLRAKLEREEEKRRWRELEKKVKPEIPPKPAVPKQAAVPELPQKYIPSPKLARVARELRVSHQEIVNAYLDSILTGKPPQGNKNLRRALIEISIDPQSDEIRSLQVGALIELRNRTGLIPSRKEVRRMFVIEAQEADDLLREAFGPGWAQEQDMLQRLAQGGKRTGIIPTLTLILTSSGKPFLTEKATTARRRELKAQGIDTVPVPVEGGFGLKRIEKEGSKHDRKNKKGLGSKIGERQKPGRPVPESGRGQETTAAGGVLQTQKGKEIKPVVPAEKPTIPTPVEKKPTTPTPVEEKPTTPTPVEEKPTTPTPVEEKPTTPTP
ncbi:MAG TPA: hypothetical protein PKV38_02745, partial [bacterium]|nr:hypothetical protein [bacterium]